MNVEFQVEQGVAEAAHREILHRRPGPLAGQCSICPGSGFPRFAKAAAVVVVFQGRV
jgi:hypothetical protein